MSDHNVANLFRQKPLDDDGFFNKQLRTRPFPLSKVMEGQPIVSRSWLFDFPPEILDNIMNLVARDKPSLAALALVNSDFRQLARSFQFAEVTFDYSIASRQLALALAKECIWRRGRRIGPCIRRVNVRSDGRFVSEVHRELFHFYSCIFPHGAHVYPDELLLQLWPPEEESEKRLRSLREEAEKKYYSRFQVPLVFAVRAMSHLEVFTWNEGMSQMEELWKALASAPLQHLQFRGPVEQQLALALESFPAQSFSQLRTLDLKLEICREGCPNLPDVESQRRIGDGQIITCFIKRCELSLESLRIHRSQITRNRFGHQLDLRSGPDTISLPCLQLLDLEELGEVNDDFVRDLLRPSLRHLFLPQNSQYGLLRLCEKLHRLETLALEGPLPRSLDQYDLDALIGFLERHPHMKKLYVSTCFDEFMNDRLLPCLTIPSWSNLSSLSLHWFDSNPRIHVVRVPESALVAIGSLPTLEQLCLTAEANLQPEWLVDHEAMQKHFRGLINLKRLAMSSDTYPIPGGDQRDPVDYYELKVLTPECYELAEKRVWMDVQHPRWNRESEIRERDEEVWERAHRYRMIKRAEAYAKVLPSLEWMYCGQWRVRFSEGLDCPAWTKPSDPGYKTRRLAWPLSEAREVLDDELRCMFAMGYGRR